MVTFSVSSISLAVIVLLATLASPSSMALGRTEEERVAEYHKRNHSWPVKQYKPETPGWRKLMEHRLRQVGEIRNSTDRFEGFAQTLSAATLQDNYTEYGFGLARAPEPLMEDLRRAIHEGVAKGPRLESFINAITEPRPWFIDRPDLTQRVLEELQEYPEQWVGFPLTAQQAYGFRLYRNQSRLHVHVDRSKTHVISFILHIDSSDDAEPWPILIEDFQGNTHEVILTSGDILFYESSKCFHGRPRPFNGTWYSSVFVHYYPTQDYTEKYDNDAKVIAIPPHWQDQPTTHYEIPLQMHGTTMEEPWCPNNWCGTVNSLKWSGPGEEGYVIDPNSEKRVLDPARIKCVDKDDQCEEWASWDSNECVKNRSFMRTNCQKSCGLCGTLPSQGLDEL